MKMIDYSIPQKARDAYDSTIRIDRDSEKAMETIEELNKFTRAFPFPEGKALISIRFDDNDETFYTNAFQIMKTRGMVGSLAFVGDRVGLYRDRPKLTDEQVIEMLQQGWELENHSQNHGKIKLSQGITPVTYDEIYNEVVQCKKDLESDFNQTIRTFVMPGNWDNNAQPPKDTMFAKVVLQHHLYLQAYVTPKVFPRTSGYVRWGRSNESGDHGDATTLIDQLNALAGTPRCQIFKFHAVGTPGGGLNQCISTEQFTIFCDRVKELIDEGKLECLTDSGLLSATIGEEINFVKNADFSRGLTNWQSYGTPTISETINWNGKNSVIVDLPNYCFHAITDLGNLGSPKFKIRVRYRAVTGTASARISISDPMNPVSSARRFNLPATEEWQTFETQTGATNSNNKLNRIGISLRSNNTDQFVAFSDIQAIRIG